MYDALYGRQSVEKKDSISVESQLEYCRYETHGGPYIEYVDRGFSGKDTKRPDFERMMGDVRAGRIRRVIVYKLDRISRSILDFANMMEEFQKYNVEFISSTEKFDTSTPIGRAMLNICIVFAQLERETIQKRVADAYCARSKKGFYMGGRIPYGFRLKETVIDGIRTSMYEEVPEESNQLKLIYSMYADSSNSLGDIARYLDQHGIRKLRGSSWSTARLSDMLRNPIYVEADIDVYHFFKEQGADICSPMEAFTGDNACYLYKGEKAAGGLAGKVLVLAPHRGFIPSGVWLACRARCLESRRMTQTCKPKNSWLSGKVKCGNCGYALTVRKSKTKWGRYFVCSRTGCYGICRGAGCTIYADVLEEHMAKAICEELSGIEKPSKENAAGISSKILKNGLRLERIDGEIEGLLSKVGSADCILMRYINDRISRLDAKRQDLQEENAALAHPRLAEGAEWMVGLAKKWDHISFEDKQAVVDALIEVVKVADGTVEIKWKL